MNKPEAVTGWVHHRTSGVVCDVFGRGGGEPRSAFRHRGEDLAYFGQHSGDEVRAAAEAFAALHWPAFRWSWRAGHLVAPLPDQATARRDALVEAIRRLDGELRAHDQQLLEPAVPLAEPPVFAAAGAAMEVR